MRVRFHAYRFVILGIVTAFLLTACPPLTSLPTGRIDLLYEIDPKGPFLDANFLVTKTHLISYGLGTVAALDPGAGRYDWEKYFDYPVAPEFLQESNEILLWPHRFSEEDKLPDPPVIVVLNAETGEETRRIALNVPLELFSQWDPRYIARKEDKIYIGATRGRIAILKKESTGIKHYKTIHIAEIYDVSGYADDPDAFVVLKVIPDPDTSDLYALATTGPGYSGSKHVYRVSEDGRTVWSAVPHIQPSDILLVNDRILSFNYRANLALDARTGALTDDGPGSTDGTCAEGQYGLHPVWYDRGNKVIYAPYGVLGAKPPFEWLWSVHDMIDRADVVKCLYAPVVSEGFVYYGGKQMLLVAEAASGRIVDIETADRRSYELWLDAPVFLVGEYIVVPHQFIHDQFLAVYKTID